MTLLVWLLLAATPPPAPAFTLPNAQGRPIELRHFKGQVVLLNFWATHCAPCVEEMPWLAAFHSQFRAQKFTVLGISLDETWAPVHEFLRRKPVPYPVLLDPGAVADRYGVDAMPVTLLLDRQGRIRWRHIGLIDRTQVEAEIRKLLR